MCELIKEAHAKSKYADYRLDLKGKFKPLCMEAIRSGNHCLFVSEKNGIVEGFLIGVTDDLYAVLKEKYATDVLFWISERDNPRNFVRLAMTFVEWARSIPGVVRIRMGVTDAVGETRPVEKMFETLGMSREGAMFDMELRK
ncbi:MAG: hypothetical protein GY832_05135 [Chloroflexi bacterium]|nr:hypothetical protein [Chloroflexota bacterium]